jgi:alanyl-tRNA synthetase
MDSKNLRKGFLDFFEKKGHKVVSSSSLIPKDPTVLFTTAGMQQFKEYFLGKSSPFGNKVTSCQKCFRTSDIEQVGDASHLTFLEMLGNFSFGDYFKEEAIKYATDFLVKQLGLEKEKIWITVFRGEGDIPEDKESKKIWQSLGFPQKRIYGFSRKDNFWGPTGLEGPCGPSSEIHYDLTGKPCEKGIDCVPNCECGRFLELWNLVFNEYYQDEQGRLTPLKQRGVDTGMGLERLAMVSQKKKSVFETDLSQPIMKEISGDNKRAKRIITDHLKSSVFIISEDILPSNLERGYVLRRLIRRIIRFGKLLNLPQNFLIGLIPKVIEVYKDVYPEIEPKKTEIMTAFQNEAEKFEKTLEKGLKQFKKVSKKGNISGVDAFHLYDTYGFPLELTEELAKEKGLKVDKEGFQRAFGKHQEISRAGAEKKFGGIGKTASYKAIKLHTATHLLHQALREVLGSHVKQMGSDITSERLRFDFSHSQKMTEEEIKKVETLVNQKIKEDLEIKKEKMPLEKAQKIGALAFFKEKYPERVIVYSINNFSKEICAGPHVKRTSELGIFKITKEESSGANIRRIKAILE